MNKLISRALLAVALISPVAAVQAAKPVGLVESSLDATVAGTGAFSQEFLLVTGSSYNPNAGTITVSSLTSLFSGLNLSIFDTGATPIFAIGSSQAGVNLTSKFSDKDFGSDLSPSTTYRLLVSGVSLQEGASFGIRGVFVQSITAVPEPETYSMLLAGLGLIGAITLRRVRKT